MEDYETKIVWQDGVAPSKADKVDGTGFGSRLLKQTIERSLRGRYRRTIDESGLHFEMVIPTE